MKGGKEGQVRIEPKTISIVAVAPNHYTTPFERQTDPFIRTGVFNIVRLVTSMYLSDNFFI